MSIRTSLKNLIRRDPETPSLRERAADLRASLSHVGSQPRSKPQPLPAPNSEEAKAAFRAACHEHSVRTRDLLAPPGLMHPTGGTWTAAAIGKALETGELTPAECARLYPLATERELRMAEIEHELNLGGLFALAYADEYPVKQEADPVLAAIAASQSAETEMTAFAASVNGRRLADAARIPPRHAHRSASASVPDGRRADRYGPFGAAI